VTTGLDRSDGATSASLGVMYEVTPLLRPYANVSRAFRAADLRERYQSGLRNDGFYWAGSPQIRPETATQFELGMKGEDERFGYAVSAFRTRIGNHITGMQLTGAAAIAACGAANAAACKQTVNLGHATLTGLEASLRWRWRPGHWLDAGYSHVRGTNGDLHEPLYQMPADTLRLGWEGRILAGWSMDVTALLVRPQKRVATGFTRGQEDASAGYGVVDVGATWRYAGTQALRLAIKNLGDKRYHEHLAEGLPGLEPHAPGRSLRISWEGQF
jgi:hemoglobin/transferrin/lactoferrin receptor protein